MYERCICESIWKMTSSSSEDVKILKKAFFVVWNSFKSSFLLSFCVLSARSRCLTTECVFGCNEWRARRLDTAKNKNTKVRGMWQVIAIMWDIWFSFLKLQTRLFKSKCDWNAHTSHRQPRTSIHSKNCVSHSQHNKNVNFSNVTNNDRNWLATVRFRWTV